MNLGGAGQPFGGAHQAEAGPVIAVQSAFCSGPDVAGGILGQGEDDQVLEAFGGAVVAETVLLWKSLGGESDQQRGGCGEAAGPGLQSFH